MSSAVFTVCAVCSVPFLHYALFALAPFLKIQVLPSVKVQEEIWPQTYAHVLTPSNHVHGTYPGMNS